MIRYAQHHWVNKIKNIFISNFFSSSVTLGAAYHTVIMVKSKVYDCINIWSTWGKAVGWKEIWCSAHSIMYMYMTIAIVLLYQQEDESDSDSDSLPDFDLVSWYQLLP